MSLKEYQEFIESKALRVESCGFDVDESELNPKLFHYQKDIVRLALKLGKFCVWAGCGLGKSFIALEWASQIIRNLNPETKVLILAPLAVARQFKDESAKLGVSVNLIKYPDEIQPGINVTNYEKLDRFNQPTEELDTEKVETLGCKDFDAVIIDESSILKSFDGKYRTEIIASFQNTPYKLSCSATPAPNDFMELGNQCEFLGVMSRTEMLAMFFTHDGGDTSKWRLMGWAQDKFWEWVCTWAIMLKKPSDLGYSDEGFELPELRMHEISVDTPIDAPEGQLLWVSADTLTDQRHIRKASLQDRCKVAADLANSDREQWLIFCDLNDESALLHKLIPDSVEVKGSDSDKHKEESLIGFQNGEIRVLVSKPSIAGFGLNLQSCHKVVFVGLSHSWEAFYQSVRRVWRFGQENDVDCYIVTHHLEGAVVANIKRKEADAEVMQEEMVKHMRATSIELLHPTKQQKTEYNPQLEMSLPIWLRSESQSLAA